MKRPVPINDEAPLASAPPKAPREAAAAKRKAAPAVLLLLLRHLELLFNFFPIIALVPQPLSLIIRQKFVRVVDLLELLFRLLLLLFPFAGEAVGVPPHGRFFVGLFYRGFVRVLVEVRADQLVEVGPLRFFQESLSRLELLYEIPITFTVGQRV